MLFQISELIIRDEDDNVISNNDTYHSHTSGLHDDSNESYDKALDSNTNTKWLDIGKGDITFEYPNGKIVGSYMYKTANDFNARDPISWKLEGSNDNSNWTTLDEQTNIDITTNRYANAQNIFWSVTI